MGRDEDRNPLKSPSHGYGCGTSLLRETTQRCPDLLQNKRKNSVEFYNTTLWKMKKRQIKKKKLKTSKLERKNKKYHGEYVTCTTVKIISMNLTKRIKLTDKKKLFKSRLRESDLNIKYTKRNFQKYFKILFQVEKVLRVRLFSGEN